MSNVVVIDDGGQLTNVSVSSGLEIPVTVISSSDFSVNVASPVTQSITVASTGSVNVNVSDSTALNVTVSGVAASASAQETFESVSKNIKSWDANFSYAGSTLASISYVNGSQNIVKSFSYSLGKLTQIVLSGDTPNTIELTKSIAYSGLSISSI